MLNKDPGDGAEAGAGARLDEDIPVCNGHAVAALKVDRGRAVRAYARHPEGESAGAAMRICSAFRGSDKTAHDRMPVVMAQAGDAAPGRVVGTLQDLAEGHLDALALGGDPIAALGIGLVIGGLAIARRRAARDAVAVRSLGTGLLEAAVPIGKLGPGRMRRGTGV